MNLEIEEWEIWHTYTTYLESTEINLAETARRLVAAGIAECAMLRDGRTFWRSEGSVGSGSTSLDLDPLSGRFAFELRLDSGAQLKPEGFAIEAWGQASYFLASERKVLGTDSALPCPYLRAYLGKCVLVSNPSKPRTELELYPTLIVYESGILIVEFRMIGPSKTSTTLKNFIEGAVNLYKYQFDKVEVAPGLAEFAPLAYHHSNRASTFSQRLRLLRLQAGHALAVKQTTKTQNDDDFSFDLAPLSSSEPDDLKSIALTIFNSVAFILGKPRIGLAFLFWGQISAPAIGEFWSGRPHIHLVRFRDQRKTAAENEASHAPDFGRILCRLSRLDDIEGRNALPEDLRLLQDYNAYLTSASSLWVWSLDGLSEQQAWMDANRGNLIYERQVLVEILEYGYMLHRSLYHQVEKYGTTAEVISVKRQIVQLQRKMREASHSGEIRELLEKGWKEMGLPHLILEIEAGLSLRESETRSNEALRASRVGWALTVIFGFVAVPALAEQVILPIWKLTPFPQLGNASLDTVVADGISLLLVVLVLLVTLLFIPSPKR